MKSQFDETVIGIDFHLDVKKLVKKVIRIFDDI